MKKSDLKPGMICELSDGTFGIVFFGHYDWGDCILCTDGYILLSALNEELVGKYLGVVAVYTVKVVIAGSNLFNLIWKENNVEMPKGWKKIWEREPELVELTLEEIAKKFDINVKSLRIKE